MRQRQLMIDATSPPHPSRSWTQGLAGLRRLIRPLDFRRVDECSGVIDWLAPAPGERILDVGCGDGYYDWRIAGAGAVVDGIDARADRLALATRWNPHPRVHLHHMSAEKLRFADGYFDKVVSICVLEHIPNDQAALCEVERVLRPGGRFVVSCDSLSNAGITDRLRSRHAQRYAVRHFYTRELLRDRLRSAGLEMLRSRYVLTTAVSLAIARFTFLADDIGRLPGGWPLKYAAVALASTVGLALSRSSERLAGGNDCGLTLLAEAVKPACPP